MQTKNRQTPWGYAQDVKEIAPGIIRYDTASHGGYWLSAERLEQMPADLRAFKPWAGEGWYEEDCDWAIVCLAFPDVFPAEHYKFAVDTIAGYKPHLLTPERKALAEQWTAANTDKWASGCQGSGKNRGEWFVNIYNLADNSKTASKVFPGVPVLPAVFTLEQFQNAPIYKG